MAARCHQAGARQDLHRACAAPKLGGARPPSAAGGSGCRRVLTASAGFVAPFAIADGSRALSPKCFSTRDLMRNFKPLILGQVRGVGNIGDRPSWNRLLT